MSSNQAGDDCVALALAFARTPGRFPDLLHGHGRLPVGVTALLQMAAGSPFRESASAPADDISGEQQQAARFFIEQVLMSHGADHYRVLGVDPVASPEEIKEHHRLLMRLFHPDRQTTPDARRDAIATRINQAYTALRYPDTRVAYDMTLAAKRKLTLPVPSYRGRPQLIDSPGPLLRMPPFVVRHLPQFALGGIALVAALGVTLVYVNRVPTGAIGTGDSKFAHASESKAPRPTPPDLPPAIVRALAESSPADLPPTATPTVETAIPVAESSRERESAVMPTMAKPAVAKPAPQPVVAPLQTPKVSSPAPVSEAPHTPAPAPAASMAPVAVNVPAAPEIKPAPLRTDQLNGLVASLAEQYQRGDLENLLALFDASARIERGDKKQIRNEYSELFRNSENRALHIWDMAWSGDGRVTRGEGSFQARVLRKGDGSPRIYNGAVTIEVIQRNDRPLIVGLYHKAEN
jgi:DnaJ-domain-containing protein 1